mgnify:CR=1 FL=1|jgi:hypothetical protein
MNDRYSIVNTNAGNVVESWRTGEQAIRACDSLNQHNVEWNKSFPRCVVIDKITGENFYTNLEHKVGI